MNENRIRHDRLMAGDKKNTIAIFFSFALTLTLITALLTLLHTNHRIENIQWQELFTASDCSISELSEVQVQKLTAEEEIDWYALQQNERQEYSKNAQFLILDRGDDSYITLTGRLESGRMPETADEVVAERWTLLNLGIVPECNQEFAITDQDGSEKTFRLVGILSDMASNKKYGLKCLYAPIDETGADDYTVYLRFRNASDYDSAVAAMKQDQGIADKQIKKCPGREELSELRWMDVQMLAVFLLIGMIVFYGIYRIALIARRRHYGLLRAVGMTRREVQHLILQELYISYLLSVPCGVLCGLGIAKLTLAVSGQMKQDIYLNAKKVTFSLVIPWLPIAVGILLIALFIGIVGILGGRRIVRSQVTALMYLEADEKKLDRNSIRFGQKGGRNATLVTLGVKYIVRDKRMSLFVVLTICTGVALFSGLVYQKKIAGIYREDTKEMNFLNGQYEMGTLWVGSATDGIDRKSAKKVEELDGVQQVKTASGIPIRVVDNAGVARNESYYDRMNERFLEYQDYPLAGSDGTDQIYKSILYGYNREALQSLKKYVIAGDYDPAHLAEDEIILSILRMDDSKENEYPGSYRDGTPLMEYQVGDTITLKYRTDFDTADNLDYEQLKDTNAAYSYKTYKVAAIVSFSYMFDPNVTVYPLLITRDEQVRKLCPDSGIQRLYIDGSLHSDEEQSKLEQELIQIGSLSSNISTRSMIPDIEKNDQLYHKQLVYIIGIAVIALLLVLINMVNNLNYRMQVRTREICMYRAIGMSVRMIRRMLVFENGILGAAGIIAGYLLSIPVLRYLYSQSKMKTYGHAYAYDYTGFIIIAVLTLLLCTGMSLHLSKGWKTRSVLGGQ